MSDERTISEIHEVENGSTTEVIVTSHDEDGNTYVGTSSYRNDYCFTESDRDDAYKSAVDDAMNK